MEHTFTYKDDGRLKAIQTMHPNIEPEQIVQAALKFYWENAPAYPYPSRAKTITFGDDGTMQSLEKWYPNLTPPQIIEYALERLWEQAPPMPAKYITRD